MHICHIYSSYFPVIYWPVVGTLGKFPNWHLFWSKFHFSIGKLWATIEILISAELSIKSIFSNIISIGYGQNFTFGPIFLQQFMFYVLSNGKFLLFLFLFDTLAIKAMKFCEISLSSHQNLLFLKCVKVVK